MGKSRLEAFSDGVIAIIITIMVLELKVPHEATLEALVKLLPVFLSYLLSFVTVALLWVNHHHGFAAVDRVDNKLLWSNNHLLFWMSLVPFVTAYMGENHGAALPVAMYGAVAAMCAVAFNINRHFIELHHRGPRPAVAIVHRRYRRLNIASALAYAATIPLAFVHTYICFAVFVAIPLLYFLPDTRALAGLEND